MNRQNTSSNFAAIALTLVAGLVTGYANADDVVPAKAQSDSQINVWVNNASLELFVSNLAVMTGREVAIEGELEGQVSGKFDGSMAEALATVGEQFPVLFDLDDTTLGAVSTAALSTMSITLSDSPLDDELAKTLQANLLPGNEIEVGDSRLTVSGHPAFVKRITQQFAPAVVDAGSQITVNVAPVDVAPADVASEPVSMTVVQAPAETAATTLEQEPDAVIDKAVSVMVNEELKADIQTETAAATVVQERVKPILWVTDIPGFETF